VLGHAIDVTDRVAVERSLRETIEQRETLSFLAGFSDRLSPLVTFDELVDVVQRLPVPFVADAAMVHTRRRRRIGAGPRRAHGKRSHEPALASLAAALIRRGGSDTMTTTLGGATAALVPLSLDGRVKAVLSLVWKPNGASAIAGIHHRRNGAADPARPRSHSAVPRGAGGQSPQG
jgi:hypothetical protein